MSSVRKMASARLMSWVNYQSAERNTRKRELDDSTELIGDVLAVPIAIRLTMKLRR